MHRRIRCAQSRKAASGEVWRRRRRLQGDLREQDAQVSQQHCCLLPARITTAVGEDRVGRPPQVASITRASSHELSRVCTRRGRLPFISPTCRADWRRRSVAIVGASPPFASTLSQAEFQGCVRTSCCRVRIYLTPRCALRNDVYHGAPAPPPKSFQPSTPSPRAVCLRRRRR